MKNMDKFPKMLPGLLLLGALLALGGCSLEAPEDPSGDINAPGVEDAGARYVAVGNSLTAGFMDGGLMQAGQAYSYPNLIAAQMGLSRTQFTQPWIASPGIGGVSGSNVTGVLHFDGANITVLGTTPLAQVQSTLLLAATQPTQYHNLGVPGAVLHDGMNAYSSATSASGANPFFDFINRATFFGNTPVSAGYPGPGGFVPVTFQSASQYYQAVAKGGALTTLWLGNNDVLGPATSGEPAPNFGNFGSPGHLAFADDYTAMLAMLAGGLAQRNNGLKPTIIVANIPSVTSTPYFIPQATFSFYVTQQIGQAWPGGFEEANVQYVRFPALSWIATANPATPIPASLTLDAAEYTSVATATTVFNQTIATVVNTINGSGVATVGLVDANDLLANDTTGPQRTHFLFLLGGGMTVAQAAATTVFSLDGIHPNSHGYGILANAFIDEYNRIRPAGQPALSHVDPAALPWDPTYGQATAKAGGLPGLDPLAAAAMDAIFR
jgi:lysophospholipase L1-like esterase